KVSKQWYQRLPIVRIIEIDVALFVVVRLIGINYCAKKKSKWEEQIQAADEEAVFGGTTHPTPSTGTDSEPERKNEEVDTKKDLVPSLFPARLQNMSLRSQDSCRRELALRYIGCDI
ncbi:serine/threonine-protein kinase fray2-like, partial [Trifolium medium]|nr:serine/threonine-protein kinase fray2-like [Trifolium medium]